MRYAHAIKFAWAIKARLQRVLAKEEAEGL